MIQPHEPQAFRIGTDEDVLSVVEAGRGLGSSARCQGARTPAEHARGFEHRDRLPRLRGGNGGREPGPAGSDDGHAHGHQTRVQ